MDNQPGQEVFSFVAPKNMTSFSQLNVLPLFQYLMDGGKMANSTYLGTAQFGTEAFHTDGKNVTFEASGIDLTVQTTLVPPAKSTATPTKSSTAPTKSSTASTKSSTATAKSSTVPAKGNTVPVKSNAVSLKGVEGIVCCWGLFEAAIGGWMLWSWML